MDADRVPGRSVRVRVGTEPIDAAALVAEVADPKAGATCCFLGTVRNHAPGREAVTHLEYEAYGETVERVIGDIVAEATERWPLLAAVVEHRVGHLDVGEASVGVATSSAHRADAFEAARYLIDELKKRAPIWKKEHWADGSEWVREDLRHQ